MSGPGDSLLAFAKSQADYTDRGIDRAVREAENRDKMAYQQEMLGMQKAQAARQEDEYNRGVAEKSATNEALAALLNPDKYKANKLSGEQAGINASLANLNPVDREIAEKELAANYNKDVSANQWLSTALGSTNADQSKVLSTQSSLLNMKLNDPNSAEYKAKQAADRSDLAWKLSQESGSRRGDARYAQGLSDTKENKAIADVLKVMQVKDTAPTEVVANQGQIDNILGKHKVYNETFDTAVKGNEKAFLAANDKLGKLYDMAKKATTPQEKKSVQSSIDATNNLINTYVTNATTSGLKASDMGKSLLSIPSPKKEMKDTKVTKEDYISNVLKELGPKPTLSAIDALAKEVTARYPKVDASTTGYNALAKQYGGEGISTNDPEVAKMNAKAAIDAESAKKAKGYTGGGKYTDVGKSTAALTTLFEADSPDVLGSGNEDKMFNEMYTIKAKYGLTDDEMASLIPQIRSQYRDPYFYGVDEDVTAKGKILDDLAAALKATKYSK